MEKLEVEIEELVNQLNSTKDPKDLVVLLSSYITLSDCYYYLFRTYPKELRQVMKVYEESPFSQIHEEVLAESFANFLEHFEQYQKLLEGFAVLPTYLKNTQLTGMRKLANSDFFALLKIFRETLPEDIQNEIKRKTEEIYFLEDEVRDCDMTFYNLWKQDSYIICSGSKTPHTLSYIYHELGHHIDFKLTKRNQSLKDLLSYTNYSLFPEVPAYQLQLRFNRFLGSQAEFQEEYVLTQMSIVEAIVRSARGNITLLQGKLKEDPKHLSLDAKEYLTLMKTIQAIYGYMIAFQVTQTSTALPTDCSTLTYDSLKNWNLDSASGVQENLREIAETQKQYRKVLHHI